MTSFLLNQEVIETDAAAGMVLLDFLRREVRIMGSKEGCREGDCGACTVLIGKLTSDGIHYRSMAACLLPLAAVAGRHVVTVEGINQAALSPVQQAIVDEGATQCGFCTPGIVVAVTGFLLSDPILHEGHARAAIEGNICRCTGYASILRALHHLIAEFGERLPAPGKRVPALVEAGVLPAYFADAEDPLRTMAGTSPPQPTSGILVAGGTDLFVQRPEQLHDQPLRCLDREPALLGITEQDGELRIGAATAIEELLESSIVRSAIPKIEQHLRLVSSRLMRNRASIGGNLANASPIGDLSIMLLALDARLELRGSDATRSLPLRAFFQSYKQYDLREGEIIEAIRIPQLAGRRFNFEKVSKRRHLDIASANTALNLRVEDGVMRQVGLSAGGVAPTPLFLRRASAALEGMAATPLGLEQALEIAAEEMAPIDDVRGSADYKLRLVQSLIRAHFVELFPENFGEEGPA